eukprot:CAMPEP_0197393166 /NCGR_PEP_ID=MMETSP1165-20131217/4160_1 /TAXON_ID=284809 /ORGANISM="Chrysocystis fragilis, Strain CCMP3189" /LENGTH=95 /DNA_ID=CAMNT_0042918825 /DNA_START=666 /DNA_END=953 /DNA_ORIENTATION=+
MDHQRSCGGCLHVGDAFSNSFSKRRYRDVMRLANVVNFSSQAVRWQMQQYVRAVHPADMAAQQHGCVHKIIVRPLGRLGHVPYNIVSAAASDILR